MKAAVTSKPTDRSLSARLVAGLAIAVIVVSALAVGAMYRVLSEAASRTLEQRADETLAYLVGTLETPLWTVDDEVVRAIGAAVFHDPSIAQIEVRNETGAVVYAMARSGEASRVERSARIVVEQGAEHRSVGEVTVALSPKVYAADNRNLLLSASIIIGAILVAVLVVTTVTIRRALKRPLTSLNQIAARFAGGHYDMSGDVLPYREFQPFGSALSQMAKTIEEQIATIREAEGKYRGIFENALEGMFQSTIEGRLLNTNPALAGILGYASAEELSARFADNIYVGRDERERLFARLHERGGVNGYEVRMRRRDGEQIWVSISARLVRDAAGLPLLIEGFVTDISERKQAEQARLSQLHFAEGMDRVNRAIQGASSLDQMMSDVLDVVLSIFDCDRAYLMYPCDPDAASWRMPMERSKPVYPRAFAEPIEMPMSVELANSQRALLAADGPLKEGPGAGRPVPTDIARLFGVQSLMAVAVHPKQGKPWKFGIHQCSRPRDWTADEENLLQEIGRRLADGLTSLLLHRDLLDSEAKYRRIVDTANEGICTVGADSRITFVNARLAEMLGYAGDEVIGRPVTDFMPEADRVDHSQRMESRREGLPDCYERRLWRKDGQTTWTLCSAAPSFDGEGRFQGSVVMLTDIAERKLAEEQLRHSERGLAAAQRIAHLGSWELDLASNELTWSDEVFRIFEMDPEKAGASYEAFESQVHPEDREMVHKAVADSTKDHLPFDFVHRLLMPDGRIKYVHQKCETYYGEDGAPCRSIGMVHDITASKNAEAAIADSQAMLTKIIDSAIDAVIITDSEHRIKVFNQAAEATFGYQEAEVVDRSAQMLVPLELRERHVKQMQSFVEQSLKAIDMGGANIRRPIYGLRSNGEVFPMEASISRIETHGQSAFVLIGRDITERKLATDKLMELNAQLEARVEERTRQLELAKNQAEAANRAKSAFLANMSHEIRTPLNSVLGMTHLALQTATTPKQRDYLEKISLSGNHLLGIISDILDLSKIEAGMFEIEVADFDLAECLDKVVQFCRLRAEAKGLALTLEIDPEIPARLRGDDMRIGQVVTNLTSNAIKFTEQGRVAIRVRLVEVAAGHDAVQRIRFEVEDTGIGIAPEATSKLFNPFQQADTSTTRKYGGTGLGLAISRQMVSLMGGQIGVDSRPGTGSRFWFEIALAPAASAAPPPAAEAARAASIDVVRAGLQGKQILVADDHPFNQEVAAEMLQAVGVTVSAADNGRQAVDLARLTPVDCVLMDVQMPQMDGYEATRQLRADPRFAELPIVAMTANASKSDRDQCLAAGMNDFISKPVRADKLYAVLLRWLADGAERRPGEPNGEAASNGGAASGRTANTRLIDLSTLVRTIGTDDPARIEKFTQRFIASITTGLAEMDDCLAAGDVPGFARIGHRIKAVASSVGAAGLADLLRAAEGLHAEGTPARAAALLAQTRAQFELIRQHLAGGAATKGQGGVHGE